MSQISTSKFIRVAVPLSPFLDRQTETIPNNYICNKCTGTIETENNNYIKYKKNVYHKHCLTCTHCSIELKGSFIFKKEEFFCLTCASAKLKSEPKPQPQKWVSTTNLFSGSGIKRSPVPDATIRSRTNTKIGGPRMEQSPMPVLHESKSETLPDTSTKPSNEAVSQRERTVTNWNFSKSQVIAKGSTTMSRPVISRVRGPSAVDSPTISRNYSNPTGNGTSRSNDVDQRGDSERLKPEDEVERLLREGREKLRLEQLKEEQEEVERAKLIDQLKNEKERQKI